MRQFLLTKGTYASGDDMSAIAEGAIGFYYNNDGVPTLDTDGTHVKKSEAMIVLGRSAANGGNVVIPFYNKNFSWNKMTHQASTKFNASIKIPSITELGEYTIIICKKGVQFNERNKWTSSYNVKSLNDTPDNVAAAIEKGIKNFAHNLGISSSVSGDTISITGLNDAVDFEILGADNLFGLTITQTHATKGYADAAWISDLADKACADAGIEYTYRPEYIYLYENYPLNPLAQQNTTDPGFIVYTIRFAEPRRTKTTDEVVNQIVQIAMPKTADAATTIETILGGIEA